MSKFENLAKKLGIASWVMLGSSIVVLLLLANWKGACSPNRTLYADIIGLSYGIITEDELDSDFSDLEMTNSLELGKEYYFVAKFTLSVDKANDGQIFLKTSITIGSIDVFETRIEDVNSTQIKEITFTDLDGKNSKSALIDSSLPDKAGAKKDIRIIMKFTPLSYGISSITFGFNCDDAVLTGACNGFTQALRVI